MKSPFSFKNIFLNYWFFLPLFFSFIFGFYAVYHQIIFGYDQARDALAAYDIWHNYHFKILGPATDINGVFHGVAWYYLLALFYGILKDPFKVVFFYFFISFIQLFFIWVLSDNLFKDKKINIVSILLYSFSVLFQSSTRWLSNPDLSIFMAPLFFLFLWKYIEFPSWDKSFLVGLFLGLIIQSDFAFIIFLYTIPFYWLLFRFNIEIRNLFSFLLGLFLSLSSFIIADIKFHFQSAKAIFFYFIKDGVHEKNNYFFYIIDLFKNFLDKFTQLISFSIFYFNYKPGLLIFSFLIILLIIILFFSKYRKQILFLSICLLNIFIFQFFHSGISTSRFIFFPSLWAIVIIVAFIIVNYLKKSFLIYSFTFIFLFSQILFSLSFIKNKISPFSVQQGNFLQDQKKVINYTYKIANRKIFAISTLTNPLFINTTWSYLYFIYGTKYGYLPYFSGKPQIYFPGAGLLTEKKLKTKTTFYIEEPTEGIPNIYISKFYNEENGSFNKKNFGKIIVQEKFKK